MTESTASYAARTKYNRQRARKYQQKKPAKHRVEMRLIDRAFALIPKTHRVLDVPCGTGRLTVHLARRGYRVSAADISEAMLELTRETLAQNGLACPVEQQDVEHTTYPDRAFDTVVCFRLFHHFPNSEIRQHVVRELCRVAAKYVVLSYFAPSVSTLKRKLREARAGKLSRKFTTPLRELKRYFAAAGFRLLKDFAQMPLVHTLHVAVFERTGEKPQ
jgi:ubiquinone/menaquinone biosynthesis C-methylase UbiE